MVRIILLLLLPILYSSLYAQDDLDIAKNIIEKSESRAEVAKALKKVILQYARVELNSDSTVKYTRKLEEIARLEQDSVLFADSYLGYSRVHYMRFNFDSVVHYSEKAIRIYERNDVLNKIAEAKVILGNTYFLLYKNKEAFQVLKEAEPHVESLDRVSVQISLAMVNKQLNDLESAMDHYNKAYEISNEINNDFYLYEVYLGTSTIQSSNAEYDKAIASLKNALQKAEEQKYFQGQAMSLHNLGLQYQAKKQYDEARSYYDQTIALFPKIDNQVMVASTYRSYAEMLVETGDLGEAKIFVEKAEDIFKTIHPGRLGYTEAIRGELAKKEGNLKESLNRFENALQIGIDNEISEIITYALEEIPEIHNKQGRFQDAFEAQKKLLRVRDSLIQLNNNREIEALKIQFDIAQYEQDILVKDKELALLDSKQKASKYRNILFGFGAMALLIFVYRQRKINKMNKSAYQTEKELSQLKEAQIDHSKKEITEYAIHLNEYNRLMDACLSRIKLLKRHTREEVVKSGLTDLQIYIKDNIEINKEKIALDTKVKSEQDDFTFNLRNKYPDLSQKEIQVAIYTLLNMTSKQAANQMGIKEQSVYNYRLSLRRKLGLTKETNLSDFLRKL
ncbi:MAG: tetratricopeptide repeat protein [Flavobacteriaceae bacterium]|nr:tetratricopeptide repeat protein [Flavobacteriaceae bacterium]